MAKKSIEEIIRQQKPGHRVVSQPETTADDRDAANVDAASHSLRELKRKYLGQDSGLDAAVEAAGASPDSNDDVEIVALEPDVNSDDPNQPPNRTKAVIVSKKAGRIIGEQG